MCEGQRLFDPAVCASLMTADTAMGRAPIRRFQNRRFPIRFFPFCRQNLCLRQRLSYHEHMHSDISHETTVILFNISFYINLFLVCKKAQ